MTKNLASAKNFDFPNMLTEFGGYVSSYDKTKLAENNLVYGSKNMYKNIAGNLANRCGLSRRGSADSTLSPISSEYVWYTSRGVVFTIVVTKNTLYAVTSDNTWYPIQTGVTNTRYVFDKWYSATENHDYLVFANGTTGTIGTWSGGLTTILRGNSTSIKLGGQVGLVGTTTITGTAITKVIPYLNTRTDNLFNGSIVGVTNPSNGDTLLYTVNNVGPITITFVTTIGATPGNVLIGANIGATMTNLLGLLNAPGVTNATQVALSAPNQTAVAKVNYNATNTLTKNGTTTWQQDGFSSSGANYTSSTISINGNLYTYGNERGAETLTIYDVVPNPSGEPVNSVAIQTVSTQSPFVTVAPTFVPDFLKTIQNQVYVGSYTSQLCYVSDASDTTNFVTVSPSIQGSPNLIVFDSTLKGITVRSGKPCIGIGTSRWGIVTYTYVNPTGVSTTTYRTTTVDYTPTGSLVAPFAHEFIDVAGDNIVYLSQDQQVRTFGNFNDSFTSNNFPSLSQELYTELQAEVFTGGGLKVIGDYIYLTAPNSGLTYIREDRQSVNNQGQAVRNIAWYAPFNWNATRVDEISGQVVAFSNSNPQIYNALNTAQFYDDSPSNESLPYDSIAKFAYRTVRQGYNQRQTLQSFSMVFSEGYIDPGTTLNLNVLYNFDGYTGNVDKTVSSLASPGYSFYIDPDSLGDSSFGDNPFGTTTDDDTSDLAKFKVINGVPEKNVFEYQLTYSSTEVSSQWSLLATATNAVITEQDPSFIINK